MSYASNLMKAILDGKHIDELPDNDPEKVAAKKAETLFTQCVALLLEHPDTTLSGLMRKAWTVYNQKQVVVGIGPSPTPAFVLALNVTHVRGMVILPPDWPSRLEQDILFQTGAVIFVSSQAVDYVEGRLKKSMDPEEQRAQSKETIRRAQSHEAIYLRHIQSTQPDWTPNPYQKMVLGQGTN